MNANSPERTPAEVLVVVGTRPEAIKLLPLIVALQGSPLVSPVVVSTGQHRDMVTDVLALAGIVPDIELPSPVVHRGLTDIFSTVMTGLEAAIAERDTATGIAPSACIVHGDTSSAAAAALAAFHRRIPVIHVEAGLRTGDMQSPFPEELNRQLIARAAAMHFAPTSISKRNLLAEGIDESRILVTGNTGIDALRIAASAPVTDAVLTSLEATPKRPVVVVTAHRRENWGAPLERIARAVGSIAERHPDSLVVVAAHPNPAVANVIERRLGGIDNVTITPPMSYAPFAKLLARADIAITDSGGIQEEAPSLGTPVLVVRESTERVEGVTAGTLEVVGTEVDAIVAAADRLLDDPIELAMRRARTNPYGDGHAADRIVAACEHLLFNTPAPAPFGPSFNRAAVLRAGGAHDPIALPPLERPSTVLPAPGQPVHRHPARSTSMSAA